MLFWGYLLCSRPEPFVIQFNVIILGTRMSHYIRHKTYYTPTMSNFLKLDYYKRYRKNCRLQMSEMRSFK